MNTLRSVILRPVSATPRLVGDFENDPAWLDQVPLPIEHFHPRSSDHRPRTLVKFTFDPANLYAIFRVEDRFVRCVHTEYESDTHKDSCVEMFLMPPGAGGYFAFEINCGGALSLRYIQDPTRTVNRFAHWQPIAGDHARQIRIYHSLPRTIDPEIAVPLFWTIELACPLRALEPYCGPIPPLPGQTWRANFFKCADDTSHPHWASWSPIEEKLDFHQPHLFGRLAFSPT